MAFHTSPAPTETELLLDAGSLLFASARLLIDHVCFKRVGLLLSLEEELVKDDRLPRTKGFGGVAGCVRHVTENGGPMGGLLRGILPHCAIAVSRKLRDAAAHAFIAATPKLDPMQRAPAQLEVLRSVVTPVVLSVLCWPVKAVYNVVLGNYMTDVVAPVAVEVSVDANAPQERYGYRYASVMDCWRKVSDRMGGMRNIINNGWEAYVAYRYLSYLLFEGAGFVLAARAADGAVGDDTQARAIVHFVESLLRELISYPCNNIMMRMSLLDTREGGDRVYGTRRYKNTLDCVRSVLKTEGLFGFYDGFRYHISVAGLILLVRYGAAMRGQK